MEARAAADRGGQGDSRAAARRARELGRSPKVGEVPEAARIKARFRIWKYALMAAGLPVMNDPEQVRAREKEKLESK